ncbi:family 16 glycosylhydrolase [Microbulbifer variabilis]|uniref:glycoside hydrolase family 16 protein n=1 Tax=Microbulbifer variabilis TaxID=266805 RepID=UPI001CFC7798|nr:glycoside hydrolase family 16 protein [Microbulbifer variabilis]
MLVKQSAMALAILGICTSSLTSAKTLIWEDNFDNDSIDKSIWTYDVGHWGWGNNELQNYTDDSDNAYIEDGNLVIQALRNSDGSYTSARLKTLGRLSYKYGSIEARIKLPDLNAGLWPAFWQLGSNYGQAGWPACGELDILEAGMAEALNSGSVNSAISGAFHWHHESDDYTGQADYGQSKNLIEDFGSNSDLTEEYHIFGMTWTPDSITMWVDDEANEIISIGSEDPAFDEFRQEHFLILNLAVGGLFPQIFTNEEITAPMPAKMYVDYVRIYDNDDNNYSTEIILAEDSAKTGNVGIYGENGNITESLELGTDTELYIWNNMESVASLEDSEALEFNIGAGDWFGMGFWMHYDLNMMHYQNGHLNLRIKTTSTETIGIGIASTGSASDTWIDLVDGGEAYGLKRDGEWHQVSIPLSKYALDFHTISQALMIRGGAPAEDFTLAIDDIYFSEGETKVIPGDIFALYSETAESDSTFELGTDGNLYVWENTLVEAPQSPFEGEKSLSYQSSGAGWFGMAFTADSYYDLSAFDNNTASLNFALKTSSNTPFKIGMKSGSINDVEQKWIEFNSGSDPYDFIRDGQWHQVSIPINDFSDEVDMSNVIQLFELLGVEGNIDAIEIDNIYFSSGTTEPSCQRPPRKCRPHYGRHKHPKGKCKPCGPRPPKKGPRHTVIEG